MLAGEQLAGSAPARRDWLLVEHPGPWGRDAPLDAPWPAGEGAALQALADTADVRLLLARRHRAAPADGLPERPVVIFARTGPGGYALTSRPALAQLPDLPVDLLANGRTPPGWSTAGPVWAVCTQGRRDACCARLGRPLAEAFAAADPDGTWEISHSGGHRFAGVVLALPEGLVHGRVGLADVERLGAARSRGELVPDLLRGRTHLSPPEQAAELALRTELARLGHPHPYALDALRLAVPGEEPAAPRSAATRTWWEVDGANGLGTSRWGAGRWSVDLVRRAVGNRAASCGKAPEPASSWFPVLVRHLG